MLNIVEMNKFKKDYKLAKSQGKSENKIKEVILKLANKIPLEERYRDHALSGKYSGKRDCHISPDWLLIYEVTEDELVLYGTGSHSYLFK